MPPKPFNPPARASTSSTSKPRGRPKSNPSNPSTTNPKRKSTSKAKAPQDFGTKGEAKARISNASTSRRLSVGSISLSDDEDEDMEDTPGVGRRRDSVVEEDDDPFSSNPRPAPQPEGNKAAIPTDLVNVLLHGFFKSEDTRLTKGANEAVGRYIETFVREGVARAEWARGNGGDEGEMEVRNGGGGYLEVEDLERLAPQLVLDF